MRDTATLVELLEAEIPVLEARQQAAYQRALAARLGVNDLWTEEWLCDQALDAAETLLRFYREEASRGT